MILTLPVIMCGVGTLIAASYSDILNSLPLSWWQQFGLFLFQHEYAPVHKASTMVWKNLHNLHILQLLITQHQCWTSLMLLCVNESKIPAAGSTSGGETETRRVEAVRAAD